MTALLVEIDPGSALPPYAQLEHQLRTMISNGVLTTGTRLPTIRQLAADLGVAAGTIARAYRELERDGLLASRVRHGTTVTAAPQLDAEVTRDRLQDAAQAFALAAHQLGAGAEDAMAAARAAVEGTYRAVDQR